MCGGTGGLGFLVGDSLVWTGGLYTDTHTVTLGDFLGTGQRLVRVSLGLGQDVLRDGEIELDITGVWPPQEGGGGRGGREVKLVLGETLRAGREAVSRSRAEWKVRKLQLLQTTRPR